MNELYLKYYSTLTNDYISKTQRDLLIKLEDIYNLTDRYPNVLRLNFINYDEFLYELKTNVWTRLDYKLVIVQYYQTCYYVMPETLIYAEYQKNRKQLIYFDSKTMVSYNPFSSSLEKPERDTLIKMLNFQDFILNYN